MCSLILHITSLKSATFLKCAPTTPSRPLKLNIGLFADWDKGIKLCKLGISPRASFLRLKGCGINSDNLEVIIEGIRFIIVSYAFTGRACPSTRFIVYC